MEDIQFMELALEQAKLAMNKGEVPVGAIAVFDGKLIAATHNSPITTCDPTAHAEITAIRAAAAALEAYRLPGLNIYVTLEPCMMCYGAMIHARVEKLVYAASDPKVGFTHSYQSIKDQVSFNHEIEIVSGIMEEESAKLLRQFFRARRKVVSNDLVDI